jgi:hypothetical protein
MLTVEHEAAEVLRYVRLKAYAANRRRHDGLRWVFEIFGWRAPKRS